MPQKPDLYDLLGVPKNASDEDIKKAYRKLAMIHHPDRAAGDAKKFQAAKGIYELLSNPARRARYDARLAQKENPEVAKLFPDFSSAVRKPSTKDKNGPRNLSRGPHHSAPNFKSGLF